MKHAIYSPLALIFFAVHADSAVAGPRVDGLARCALSDFAAYRAPVAEETPTLSSAALATDDLACAEAEMVTVSQDCGAAVATAVAATKASTAGWAGDLVRRTVATFEGMMRLPARYGIALFGGGDPVPAKPKVPKKPRMLTLF